MAAGGGRGMGEVVVARDPRLGRDVAIKVLPPAFASDAGRLARFEQEARAAAALDHPNILAIHDIGRHDGAPFIVMEYVRGETLAAHMRREPVSCARALEIGSEIAAALAAAHKRGIVHRDLKPGNIMMTPDGHVKVLDFGLAKSVAIEDAATTTNSPVIDGGHTLTGHVVGTPAYMSPEQLRGHRIDHRTDIYSLGVILSELLMPVEGDRRSDRSVPDEVIVLIARTTARDAASRPQSADALGAELRRLIGTASAPLSGTRSESRARWGRSAGWSLAAAVIIAIAAIVTSRWVTQSASVGRPVIAVLPFTNLSGDPSKAYLGVGIADTLTTSLGRLSSVSVVSRSARQESGELKTTDVAKIARDLGATMLVQGSVQQSGDRLRVSANLVMADGKVVWSGDSEASLSDLFPLENRLASVLIDALRITVSSEERQRLTGPPTANRDALDAYWQGLAVLDRADDLNIDEAISRFQRAITIDPQFALAHAGLGEAHRRKSVIANDAAQMTRAIEEVSEALRLDPDQTEVRLSLANVYRSTGRNGAAVEELRKALSRQPLNDDAHRRLGDLLASEGRPDEALAELQYAVTLRPLYWRNQQSLGQFYLRQGKTGEAIATLTRLTQLKPDDASPYQQLGAAYQIFGDKVHARQNYERAIGLNPTPGSYTNLGTIDYSEGRFEEAARSYETAVRLAPNRALYRRNLGDAYMKLQRYADAKAAYEKAVQLAEAALAVNPSDATTMSQLGVYEAKVGKRREADRHTSAAIGINPTNADVLYRRAVALALNGDPDSAVTQLSTAISRGYSRQLALEDDDLATIRSLPSFQALVRSTK